METLWVKTEERKPDYDGFYVVCYANPYSKDEMTIDKRYFHNGYFDHETSGANYIAFWLDGLELPQLSFKERNKLVYPLSPSRRDS